MRRPGRVTMRGVRALLLQAPGLAMAGIFIAISAMMSVACGYRLGEPSGNALVFAAVALGVEAFADLSIPLFWRRVGFVGRTLLIIFFAVCLAYKLEAAKRFAAENFGMRDAAIAKAAESYDIALGRVEVLRKTLADNAEARSVVLIQTEIDALLRDPKAEGCAGKTNGPVTAVVCPKVDALRGELARAKVRDQAQADLVPALTEWRAASPAGGKTGQDSAGPAQAILALAGITVASWSALMATLVMGIVEGGAIIVPALIGFAAGDGRKPVASGDASEPASPRKPPVSEPQAGETELPQALAQAVTERTRRDMAELTAFLGECSERAPGERVQASAFHALYCQWKTRRGEAPITAAQFGVVLTRHLGLAKRKSEGRNWYLGVRLRHPAQGRKGAKHLQAVAS